MAWYDLAEIVLDAAIDLWFDQSFTFLWDNNPNHTVRATMERFGSQRIAVLE